MFMHTSDPPTHAQLFLGSIVTDPNHPQKQPRLVRRDGQWQFIKKEAIPFYLENGHYTFSIALHAMRTGYRVRQRSWPEQHEVQYHAGARRFMYSDGQSHKPWMPEMDHILGDDWQVCDTSILGTLI